MLSSPDDKIIIKKLRKGDVLSFDIIFRKYNRKVYYFAVSYLKNREEAEDVVQEVFMNLWRFRDQINEDYEFSRFLFKITYNSTCKKFRKQLSDKRQMEEAVKYIAAEDNQTSDDIEYDNLLENASLLAEKLPARQRKIFLLSINDQLTTEQIAEKMCISKKTVENYLALAKNSLRKSLSAEHFLHIFLLWL